jgi:hypothetical protein
VAPAENFRFLGKVCAGQLCDSMASISKKAQLQAVFGVEGSLDHSRRPLGRACEVSESGAYADGRWPYCGFTNRLKP